MRHIASIALLAVLAGPASAQTVDANGATQLQDNLARYVSKSAFDLGVLKITPEGDSYKVDVNVAPLAKLIKTPEPFSLQIAPYALKLRPQGETWAVEGNLFPNGSFEIPALMSKANWTFVDGKFNGVFDPRLGTFSKADGSYAAMTMLSADANTSQDVTYGPTTVAMNATPSADGGADFTWKQTSKDYANNLKIKTEESGAEFPVTVNVPSIAVQISGTNARATQFLDLLAFFVANPDEAKIKGKQDELRALITAALPLWNHLEGAYGFSDVAVNSPIGSFNAGKFDLIIAADGVKDDAVISYGIKGQNMKAASLFMPSWAVPLLPTEMDLTFKGADLDLDQPVRKAIAAFDLNQDPPIPDAVGQEIARDFQASKPRIQLAKSFIKNAGTEISGEGEMTFDAGKPAFIGTFEAAGYDKIIEALQAAATNQPDMGNAVLGAQMAKGMAKTLPDGRLQWAVEVKPDGSVLINGSTVKGPDPVEPELAPSESPQP